MPHIIAKHNPILASSGGHNIAGPLADGWVTVIIIDHFHTGIVTIITLIQANSALAILLQLTKHGG
jgi:hypothetical protein